MPGPTTAPASCSSGCVESSLRSWSWSIDPFPAQTACPCRLVDRSALARVPSSKPTSVLPIRGCGRSGPTTRTTVPGWRSLRSALFSVHDTFSMPASDGCPRLSRSSGRDFRGVIFSHVWRAKGYSSLTADGSGAHRVTRSCSLPTRCMLSALLPPVPGSSAGSVTTGSPVPSRSRRHMPLPSHDSTGNRSGTRSWGCTRKQRPPRSRPRWRHGLT